MAQISISHVESLEDAVIALQTTYELAQQEANSLVIKTMEKLDEAEKEAGNSRRLFEEAQEQLDEAMQELREAEENLRDAQNNLSEAESDLSSCEAGGYYDEDGNFIPPDCSWEASNVSSAMQELSQAEADYRDAQAKVEEAQAKLQRMQNRLELAEETLAKARDLQNAVAEQCRARLHKMESLLETGVSRLTHARAALEAYLEANSNVKAFYNWYQQAKNANKAPPRDLNKRFDLNQAEIKKFMRFMQDRMKRNEEALAQVQKMQAAAANQNKDVPQKTAEALNADAARASHDRAVLEAYWEANPDAKAFYDWLHWEKNPNEPISPQDLHDRFDLNQAQLEEFMHYLSYNEPAMRGKIAGYQHELAAAQGPVERKLVMDKMRKNFSGYIAEKIAEYALKPFGDVKIHTHKSIENGKATIIDIIVEDLKNPVILGKGKGMAAPKEGKIAVEVKSGKAAYLKAQQEHMVLQAKGHEEADASFTLCTRDIKDMSPELEDKLREELRKAGSPIIGMLPKKDELDRACWKAVIDEEHEGGNKTEKDAAK